MVDIPIAKFPALSGVIRNSMILENHMKHEDAKRRNEIRMDAERMRGEVTQGKE